MQVFLDGLLHQRSDTYGGCDRDSLWAMKFKAGTVFIALVHLIHLVGGGVYEGRGHVQAPRGGASWGWPISTRIGGLWGMGRGGAREEAALALGYVLRMSGGADARGESDVVSEQEAQVGAAASSNNAATQRDAADRLHQWNLERAEVLRELKAQPIEVPGQFRTPWQDSAAWSPVKDEITFKERLEAAIADADGIKNKTPSHSPPIPIP